MNRDHFWLDWQIPDLILEQFYGFLWRFVEHKLWVNYKMSTSPLMTCLCHLRPDCYYCYLKALGSELTPPIWVVGCWFFALLSWEYSTAKAMGISSQTSSLFLLAPLPHLMAEASSLLWWSTWNVAPCPSPSFPAASPAIPAATWKWEVLFLWAWLGKWIEHLKQQFADLLVSFTSVLTYTVPNW